jgi:hypothetical protein
MQRTLPAADSCGSIAAVFGLFGAPSIGPRLGN